MKFSKSNKTILIIASLILTITSLKLFETYNTEDAVSLPCFSVGSRNLCINALYHPGKIIKSSDSSSMHINADGLFMSSNWVRIYITRYGNHRDDPGAEFYDYAVAAPDKKRLVKIQDDDEYAIFKNPNDKPGSDVYLFLLKATNEKFIYQCIWTKTCSIKSTYNGELRIDIQFGTENINRRDLKKISSAFITFKSALIHEK